jgi:hypothetical protein
MVKKKTKSSIKQVELKPRLNNANSIGSIDGGSDENDGQSLSDNNLNNSGQQDQEQNAFDLIERKMKNFKMNNELDKVKSLLELKQLLAKENENKKKPAQPQFDLNQLNVSDLEDCLKILTNNINTNKEKINILKTKNAPAESDEEIHLNKNRHSTLSSLDDEFKKSLSDLESKFIEFERQTGKSSHNGQLVNGQRMRTQNQSNSSNSSYTLSLINMISRLIDYLRETQLELNHEKLKQTESNKQLDIHRKLIDGLTTEILCVKEQNEKIINEFANNQAKMETELEQLKVILFYMYF